jgi:hypothetical protein
MNRYKSRYRWRKVEAGHYVSPDGRYGAAKGYGKWWLVRFGGTGERRESYAPFLTLADCQEIAANMEATRQVMAKLEGERP